MLPDYGVDQCTETLRVRWLDAFLSVADATALKANLLVAEYLWVKDHAPFALVLTEPSRP